MIINQRENLGSNKSLWVRGLVWLEIWGCCLHDPTPLEMGSKRTCGNVAVADPAQTHSLCPQRGSASPCAGESGRTPLEMLLGK